MSEKPKKWEFRNRWHIEGCLLTLSPFHTGSGGTVEREGLKDGDDLVEVTACFTDCRGRPCIPGSALKGNLRSWAERYIKGRQSKVSSLFGREPRHNDETDQGEGGKAEFWDARVLHDRSEDPPLAHWDAARQTSVDAAAAINRRTGAVEHEKLFHRETVPPGTSFHIAITGQNMDDDEVALLLAALEGFNAQDRPLALGADTTGGKGRFHWSLGSVRRFDKDDLAQWIQAGAPSMPEEAMQALPHEEMRQIRENADDLIEKAAKLRTLTVDLALRFDGPFLVSEPVDKKDKEDKATADSTYRKDVTGNAVLPAASFRGAVRAHAERILRTLGGDDAACRVTSKNPCCKSVEKSTDVKKLCPACRLFGAAGWKSPMDISDFVLKECKNDNFEQDFVAIDRFTGGGAEHLKFNTKAVLQPVMKGSVTLRLDRVPGPWGLGLLALVFRDLREGDIFFGSGSAKGYGSCTADVVSWRFTGALPKDGLWREILQETKLDEESFRKASETGSGPLPDDMKDFIMKCVEACRVRASEPSREEGDERDEVA